MRAGITSSGSRFATSSSIRGIRLTGGQELIRQLYEHYLDRPKNLFFLTETMTVVGKDKLGRGMRLEEGRIDQRRRAGMGASRRLPAKEGAKVVLGDVPRPRARPRWRRSAGGRGRGVRPPRRHQRVRLGGAVTEVERWYEARCPRQQRGHRRGNRIEDTTLADWEWIMAVNSTGVFLGTRA
jgi:hypothetical protein